MRKLQILALIGALALAIAACSDNPTTPSGGGTTSPTPTGSPLNNMGTTDVTGMSSFSIELDDRYFKPTFFKATPGQKLNIELENEGTLPHNFTIDALSEADYTVQPGTKMEIDLALPSGTSDVAFYCKFHVTNGMRGAFFFGATPSSVGYTPSGSTY